MALVITMHEGDAFEVLGRRFELTAKGEPQDFVLREGDKEFRVVDGHSTKIAPHVRVSAGSGHHFTLRRVVVEAPTEVRVTRLPAKKGAGDDRDQEGSPGQRGG